MCRGRLLSAWIRPRRGNLVAATHRQRSARLHHGTALTAADCRDGTEAGRGQGALLRSCCSMALFCVHLRKRWCVTGTVVML